MNEFVGKKIGEVLAFSRVGVETLDRGTALAEVVGADQVDNLKQSLQRHYDTILALAGEQSATAEAKADATSEKLRTMRDTYIADAWDNPVEILEWLGFFEGAAIVHCALVRGAGEGLGSDELASAAADAAQFHTETLTLVKDSLHTSGQNRATA